MAIKHPSENAQTPAVPDKTSTAPAVTNNQAIGVMSLKASDKRPLNPKPRSNFWSFESDI